MLDSGRGEDESGRKVRDKDEQFLYLGMLCDCSEDSDASKHVAKTHLTLKCVRYLRRNYLDFNVVVRALDPSLNSRCAHRRGEAQTWGSSDGVFQ